MTLAMTMSMNPGKTMHSRLLLLLIPFALAACEQLGIEDPAKIAEKKEAEGKAIGSGCRHAGRALEDCYILNPKALKAAVFTGWREMDGYMRDNKIDNVTPTEPRPRPAGEKGHDAKPAEAKPAEAKPAETKHEETKPGEAKPAETKPAADKPKAEAAKPAAKH